MLLCVYFAPFSPPAGERDTPSGSILPFFGVCVHACEKCYLVVLQRSRVEWPAQEELSYHTAQ